MAQHFQQALVNLCGFGLAFQAIVELAFNHVKSGFNIASLVVMPHKLLLVELKVVKHFAPSVALVFRLSNRAFLEWNKRCSA